MLATCLMVACSSSTMDWNLPKFALLETTVPNNILDVTAVSGGNVTNDGGSPVEKRGVCYSRNALPTVVDSTVLSGNGTGEFTAKISGLKASTTYYLRAFATTKAGTAYGKEESFTTLNFAALTTKQVSNVALTSADCGGNVVDGGGVSVTGRGICFALNKGPVVTDNVIQAGSGLGEFTVGLSMHTPGTTYYIRAYAINLVGTMYGNEVVFTTASLPTLTTVVANSVTQTAAKSGGTIASAGSSGVLQRGICFDTKNNPTIENNVVLTGTGTGTFSSTISGLIPGTTYFVRAFATNGSGTSYGNEISFTTNPILVPTLATSNVTSITRISAISGGNISSDGGNAVVMRGICYSLTPAPTTAQNVVEKGGGTGGFTGDMTGLTPGTTYYLRAFATNSAGTAYGNELTFVTNPILVPVVTTSTVTTITRISANSGGNVTNDGGSAVLTKGICFGTLPSPTISQNVVEGGSGTGSFTANLTLLIPGTTYYVRAYATNIAGIAYGTEISFSTNPIVPPVLTTNSVSSLTRISAVTGGNVSNDGGSPVTVRGVCYGTVPNPTTGSDVVEKGTGTGSFGADLTLLTPGTTYYARAYAVNIAGTAYGNEIVFTTNPIILPVVSTSAATTITRISAISGGNVTNDGGNAVSAKGICYSLQHNPTLTDNPVEKGTGLGSFVADITGLNPGTTYYIRAFATNSAGTAYGSEVTFATNPIILPTLSTVNISLVQTTSATSGGNVTNDGGSPVISRGICFGPTPNPTIAEYLIDKGPGSGSFAADMMGLTPATVYYVRAFAINSAGTAYGNDITFTTKTILLPTVGTVAVSAVTKTTAVSGGNVTNDGGGAVFAKGFCYGISHLPTTSQNNIDKGPGTGNFEVSLTGLTPGTTYYARAYATNSAGTAYGNEVSLLTLPDLKIGQSYQGGLVFYLDATTLHGLISATYDQSVGAPWGCSGTLIPGSQGTAVGTGMANTIALVADCTTAGIAAKLCSDLVASGYSDWYLPSREELNLMYEKLKLQGLGGFSAVNYWSSTETTSTTGTIQSFSNGSITQASKSALFKVRAIRTF